MSTQALSTFILIVHTLIALALVGTILMQKSEGGALGIGGGPSGLMTARGAGNLLTSATKWLAVAFLCTSLGLAILASQGRDISAIDTSLSGDPAALAPSIADDVGTDDTTDPALASPTPALDDVPFGIPGVDPAPATNDDVPTAE